MPRTFHAAWTFRLSCGCLAEYTGIQADKTGRVVRKQEVICVNCRETAVVGDRYPAAHLSCSEESFTLQDSQWIKVHCGLKPDHGEWHYDPILKIDFMCAGKPKSGRYGNTMRS